MEDREGKLSRKINKVNHQGRSSGKIIIENIVGVDYQRRRYSHQLRYIDEAILENIIRHIFGYIIEDIIEDNNDSNKIKSRICQSVRIQSN